MTLTAKEFIAKWQASTLKERSASQSHFNMKNHILLSWLKVKYGS